MGFHLSERRRGDTIYLYACRDWTDPQTHKRRKEQYGLGCVKNGICHFNDNAIKFAEVFVGGKYETQYWQWRKLRSVQETEEVIYSMSEVVNSEDRNAGLFLLCESQIKRLEISAPVRRQTHRWVKVPLRQSPASSRYLILESKP